MGGKARFEKPIVDLTKLAPALEKSLRCTQGMTKWAGGKIGHDLVNCHAEYIEWLIRCRISCIRSRFNCYQKLWLYIDKADYKALRRDFTVIRRNPENDIYVECGQ